MFLGFAFDPLNADEQCQLWLESSEDIDLEHLETQRASIEGMLKHDHLLSPEARRELQKAELRMYRYLCDNGAVSSPVLRDEALGGDLLHILFESGGLDNEVD